MSDLNDQEASTAAKSWLPASTTGFAPARRGKRGRGTIAAAVLFFFGAALAGGPSVTSMNDYYFPGQFSLCSGLDSYPWGWSYGFSHLCITGKGSNTEPMFVNAYYIIAFLSLLACGVVSLVIGKKDFKRAVFLIGAILGAVTVISTIVNLVDSAHLNPYFYYLLSTFSTVTVSLLYLALPAILVLLSKMTSEKSCQLLQAASLAIMGYLFVGIAQYEDVIENIGNVPLFVAVIVTVFAFPTSSPQETGIPVRSGMLVATSALIISEGASYLLPFANGGFNKYTLIAVYLVAVGVLGLTFMGDRSKDALLAWLGLGLVVAQFALFFLGDWSFDDPYHMTVTIVFLLGFLVVSILYIVGAMKLGKNPNTFAYSLS